MTNEESNLVNIEFFSDFQLLKSFDVFSKPNSTIEEVRDVIPKIKPFSDGGTFLVRKDLQLKPGDKVVVGLASSPSIDLVNDAILDIEETFGDHIEDFLKSGRVFYEHGYKLVGKSDPKDMYDVPLGVPIAVQYNKSKLYVWILLDMNHPLSKKVYSVLSNQDERVSRTFGLSIGAIPLGKGTTKVIDGKKVNVPPKMRLYEVSFTGQPINTETWSKIVKSLLYNNEEEENMKKERKLKAVDDDKKMNLGDVLSEAASPEDNQDDTTTGDAMQMMGQGVEGEKGEGGGELPGEVSEQPEGEAGTVGSDAVLSDLLSEESEEEQEQDESMSNALVLDKLDMLSSRMEQLEEMLNKLMDMEQKENELENPNAVESVMQDTQAIKSSIDKITKSLDVLKDGVEMLSHLVKSVQTNVLKEQEQLKSMVNEKLQSVQKSLLSQTKESSIKNKAVVGVNTKQHPALGSNFEEKNNDFELKIKSILSDKEKLTKLKSMYESYKKFRGSPIEISNFESKLYEKADKELGLNENEVKRIFKELKMKGE